MVILSVIKEALLNCDNIKNFVILLDYRYFQDIQDNIDCMTFPEIFIQNFKSKETESDRINMVISYLEDFIKSYNFYNIHVLFTRLNLELGDDEKSYIICLDFDAERRCLTPYAF